MPKNSFHASRNSFLCSVTIDCIARQLDGVEPELSRQVVAIDMNVRRFVGFVAVKVEPIRARPEHSRHVPILTKPMIRIGVCLRLYRGRACNEICVQALRNAPGGGS